jgi:uncharacterized membrane protein YesL
MGLFNRLIYGNPNKPDLEVEENPNPIKSFFEVLKIKIWDLVKLNLLFALFVLPAAIWSFINMRIMFEMMTSYSPEGTVTNLFLESGAVQYMSVYLLGMIPCFLIMGVALPSLNYITRSYAREFHVWMMEDFLEKIKENWKQSLLYMLLFGVVFFIMFFAINLYNVYSDIIPGSNIFKGMIYVMWVLIAISSTFVYPLMVTFELKFKHVLKNSFLLTIAKLPQTLLILLITAIIPIFLVWLSTVWGYGVLVFVAYYALFGFSFTSFVINAYTNQVFEKIIVANENAEAERKPDVERKD